MFTEINSLKLNKKNKRIYRIINSTIFFILFLIFLLTLYRIIFPSQYFLYSFNNVNSLKNTITDTNFSKETLNFFASTPFNFSQIKINIKLEKPFPALENKDIFVQKSYKALFYPLGENLNTLNGKEENSLISIDESVFILGNNQLIPIDNPLTFESLNYKWENIKVNDIDLSTYEKQKLADISAAHPTGTIIHTSNSNEYYFIDNFTKRKIINPQSQPMSNVISVDEINLDKKEHCLLADSSLFNETSYACTIDLSQTNNLVGKDYRFSLENLPADLKIKQINLEFQKTANRENICLFLGNLKKNILYRFGFKEE